MTDLTGQCGFAALCRAHHGTIPDQPHPAGRGGSFAHSRDSVAGDVRQPQRPWPTHLHGILLCRRDRSPPGCRLHEGAGDTGGHGPVHRLAPAPVAAGDQQAAPV